MIPPILCQRPPGHLATGQLAVRTVRLERSSTGYGFTLMQESGGFPLVSHVEVGATADNYWQGLIVGDRILQVNGMEVRRNSIIAIVNLIKTSTNGIILRVFRNLPSLGYNERTRATNCGERCNVPLLAHQMVAATTTAPTAAVAARCGRPVAAREHLAAEDPPSYSAFPLPGEITIQMTPRDTSCAFRRRAGSPPTNGDRINHANLRLQNVTEARRFNAQLTAYARNIFQCEFPSPSGTNSIQRNFCFRGDCPSSDPSIAIRPPTLLPMQPTSSLVPIYQSQGRSPPLSTHQSELQAPCSNCESGLEAAMCSPCGHKFCLRCAHIMCYVSSCAACNCTVHGNIPLW